MNDYQRLVNALTNHQRNQWAKKKYPGSMSRPKNVAPLIEMFPDVAKRLGIIVQISGIALLRYLSPLHQ